MRTSVFRIIVSNSTSTASAISPQYKNFDERSYYQDIIQEPETLYKTTGFKKFFSFEEMNENDAMAKAAIHHEQHLMSVTKRIKEMYTDELKKPMDKTLKFRNN